MLVIAFAALALAGVPQDPGQTPAVLPDVVVEGQAPRREARAFIAEVGKPNPGATLARWHQAICVNVVNLRPDLAEQIVARVTVQADAVGVRTRREGCRPNIIIVATDAAEATARGLVRDDPLFFRPAGGGTDLGPSALRRFVESDAPVRWWQVAMPVSNDTGQMAIALDAQAGEDPPIIADRAVSRLQSTIRSDLAWMIIIIDVTRTSEVPVSSLADYVSMVALAQINLEADMSGRDTILNLFEGPSGAREMTEWDLGYIRALYAVPTGRPSSGVQARDILRSIMRDRGVAPEADPE